MVDITKTLSVCVVTRMNKKGGYTEHEKQVFEYGVELMLNSILKIFVYMIIGFLIGREKEIIVAIGLFSILRKISGGRHAKTAKGCFLITGIILFSAIMIPGFVMVSNSQYILIATVTWCIYLAYAPMDEYYYSEQGTEELNRQKIKVVILVGIMFVSGYYIEQYWKMVVLVLSLLQSVTLIDIK